MVAGIHSAVLFRLLLFPKDPLRGAGVTVLAILCNISERSSIGVNAIRSRVAGRMKLRGKPPIRRLAWPDPAYHE